MGSSSSKHEPLHTGPYRIRNLNSKFKSLIIKNKGIAEFSSSFLPHNRYNIEYKMSLVPPYSITNVKNNKTIYLKRVRGRENINELWFNDIKPVGGYSWKILIEVHNQTGSIMKNIKINENDCIFYGTIYKGIIGGIFHFPEESFYGWL